MTLVTVDNSTSVTEWMKRTGLEYGKIYNSNLVPSIDGYTILEYKIREKIDGKYTGNMVYAIPPHPSIFPRFLFLALDMDNKVSLSKRIMKAYDDMKKEGVLSHFMGNNETIDVDALKVFASKCAEVYGKLTENKPIVFEIYRGEVNWRAGSFGNPSSCWLSGGSYGRAKGMIEALMDRDKAFTIRFYSTLGSGIVPCPDTAYVGYSGYGRMWGIMVEDNPVLFNAYPSHSDGDRYLTSLSGMIGLDYTKIDLCEDSRDMYINNGEGYLLHDKGEYNDKFYKTVMDVGDYEDDDSETCTSCGHRISSDDAYYVESVGDTLCRDCFERDYFYCSECSNTFEHSEGAEVARHSHWGGTYTVELCTNCLEREGYVPCVSCEEYHLDYVIYDGDTYCEDCARAEGIKSCPDCGEYHKDDCTLDGESTDTCDYCLDKNNYRCGDCGGYSSEAYETVTGFVCEHCKDTRGYEHCDDCDKYVLGCKESTCPYCGVVKE